ncbi:hypothetical protein FHX44_115964 [Pseudonocardia hierapolitana]|uniref:Uncharacterized protein n=1 Tax=Pseudonocardia hierapolitana TaxID=1128676 RepID=A0A561SYT9_9PSEU|nr:hypothetical protein FHX44_115964 [Pseudonocardia hierapolitana]
MNLGCNSYGQRAAPRQLRAIRKVTTVDNHADRRTRQTHFTLGRGEPMPFVDHAETRILRHDRFASVNQQTAVA